MIKYVIFLLLTVFKSVVNEKKYFLSKKNRLNKSNTEVKVFFYMEILIFLLQDSIDTFYNLCYDYWNLITKFKPCSFERKKLLTSL